MHRPCNISFYYEELDLGQRDIHAVTIDYLRKSNHYKGYEFQKDCFIQRKKSKVVRGINKNNADRQITIKETHDEN